MKKNKNSKIFVLGYFGYLTNQLDGQTIKTRMIHELFENKLKEKISFFDTQNNKKNPFSVFSLVLKLFKAKDIIYLPAGNSLRKVFPFIYYFSLAFNSRIHYFVVGGWLPKLLQKKPELAKMLSKIEGIYVETNLMKDELEQNFGFHNIILFPNFRNQNEEIKKIDTERTDNEFRIVFMSRINKKKGIEMIFQYAKEAPKNISIDFYGPIKADEKEYFYALLSENSNVSYKGILKPNEICNVMSAYDLLVLPTQYYTEGLPGAIVDAYFSSIPVLVTNWIHANEFVVEGKTGYIIPFENGYDVLVNRIALLNKDRELLATLKRNAFLYSDRFKSDFAWDIIKNKF